MLDDDFKEIEDFLKTGGNSELQVFEKFEKLVKDFVSKLYDNNLKEGFFTLNKLIYHSHSQFEIKNEDVIKDFAITVTIIKNLVLKIQSVTEDTILTEKDKKQYINLMKLLVDSLKKEAESNLNYFKIFTEYLSDIKSSFS